MLARVTVYLALVALCGATLYRPRNTLGMFVSNVSSIHHDVIHVSDLNATLFQQGGVMPIDHVRVRISDVPEITACAYSVLTDKVILASVSGLVFGF